MRKQTDFQKAIEMAVTKGRGYAGISPRARKFYDKDGKSPECLEYMENLNPELAPFDCPHMRILLEDMKVIRQGAPPRRYKKGDLLCLELARESISRRCGVQRGNIFEKDGKLGVLCKAELYAFELVVSKAEP